MKSLIDYFTSNTRERMNNKFIYSFVVSWLIFNFKGIAYFIFANVKIDEKLKTITDEYICDGWSWVAPLLFALFYVLALPYIQNGIDMLTAKSNKIRVDLSNEKEIGILKQKLKVVNLNVEIKEAENDYSSLKQMTDKLNKQDAELKELGSNNLYLQQEIEELQKSKLELEMHIKQIDKKDISEEERNQYIKDFNTLKENESEYNFFIQIGTLISKGESVSNIDHIVIERFKANKLIQQRNGDDNGKYFNFTKKGSVFWTQYVLGTSEKRIKPYKFVETDDTAAEYLFKAQNKNSISIIFSEMTSEIQSILFKRLFPGVVEDMSRSAKDVLLKTFAKNNTAEFLKEYRNILEERHR